MRKLFIFIFLTIIITFNQNRLYASRKGPGGDHGGNHHCGALEYILKDFKSATINTDECILYGCYVLAAQEPSRSDREVKLKLLPSKYNIAKNSSEEGPYFFVYQIYKLEDSLSEKALKEFRNSDWSDYEFLQDLYNNNDLQVIISKTPLFTYNNHQYKNYGDIIKQALKEEKLKPETIYFKFNIAHLDKSRFSKKYLPFMSKNNLRFQNNSNEHLINELLIDLSEKQKMKLFNRKLINLMNYFYYALEKINSN